MTAVKKIIAQTPILGKLAKTIYFRLRGRDGNPFPGSSTYWESRYRSGGNSSVGSYGLFAQFKAEVINDFLARRDIHNAIEFGCGDGNQLGLIRCRSYLGFDVSANAVKRCQRLFKSDRNKTFRLMTDYVGDYADLTLSLDVIFHLVEDNVFEHYMRRLFAASNRYVIIYASDSDDNPGDQPDHVRHRAFTGWIQRNLLHWKLVEHIPNRYPYRGDYRTGSFAEFFFYEKAP